MKTPIDDFVRRYAGGDTVRLHMPGHKGKNFTGAERFDITEICGADELYEADGIIAESERNASLLFGSGKTLYSTEGSSQCIRAMVYLATLEKRSGARPYILAGRNAHRTFIYALALCDIDVRWLIPEKAVSLCRCDITARDIKKALQTADRLPSAVYVTSPDYLGNMLDIRSIADACHAFDVPLIVDNAHGAYLKFLSKPLHPLECGADMCCDSAHKTFPVLTGGAYLHISRDAPQFFENAKNAMALFGSTSPSYLILRSLDLCNAYLAGTYPEKLERIAQLLDTAKNVLMCHGWQISGDEPMKLTVVSPDGADGRQLADMLRSSGIECEYADGEYVVLMPSSETDEAELERVIESLGTNSIPYNGSYIFEYNCPPSGMTVREAVFSPCETICSDEAVGRICASPVVSCPPAIPVVVSGEIITKQAVDVLRHYRITRITVVKE